ncbi:MAG: hypothetical protein ACI9YO_002220, partial [Gammaproteobacteria bacterium]
GMRDRMRLLFHLLKNALSDIIISAPVGWAFGISKLIHKIASHFVG